MKRTALAANRLLIALLTVAFTLQAHAGSRRLFSESKHTTSHGGKYCMGNGSSLKMNLCFA